MKRTVLFLLILALLGGTLTAFSSCSRAPKIDDVKNELIALIEASFEINTVFFGAGLPVYDRSDVIYADLYNVYASSQYVNSYDVVDRTHAKFTTINQIKAAASLVYSPQLLEEILFVNAFVGYALSDATGKFASSPALFVEDDSFLYQSRTLENKLPNGQKVYDYSTMKIARPSGRNAIFVTLSCFYASNPTVTSSARLRFVKTASGWRLDSFTV